MPRLIQLNGSGATRQLALRVPMTMIGRAETNDIVLDNVRASRFHAALVTHGAAVTIEDLSSRNGLFVNGVRIANAQLANGDTIVLGGAMFRFLAEARVVPTEPLYLQPRPLSSDRSDARIT
ncbi:MAG: hypothetical protein JWQ73_3363 [Variovorax sp.]|jgi:pSer/pThr/pTyr-binding forkhead associated (FHA) protein|nr:hypothetical protein [Variovorax sp.]